MKKKHLKSPEKRTELLEDIKNSSLHPQLCEKYCLCMLDIIEICEQSLTFAEFEAAIKDLLSFYSSLYIEEQYEILRIVLQTEIAADIKRAFIQITVNTKFLGGSIDISNVLKNSLVTFKDKITVVSRQTCIFLDKNQTDNILFLFCGIQRNECVDLLNALFAAAQEFYTEIDEEPDDDFEYYKTSALMTLASCSTNKDLLRVLTMVMKYNYGTMSLRGIIRDTNIFFKYLSNEERAFIMRHNNEEFFYDFGGGV